MTPTDWHSPLRCPRCEANAGHPFSVHSHTSKEVIVNVSCVVCKHEWKLVRETPTLAPKRDGRLPDDAPE
jgi:formate dehydrogenase maturation protein FdhE